MAAMRINGTFRVNSGTFKDQLVIRRKTSETQAANGEVTATYSDLMTIWARVRALSGNEIGKLEQRWAEARFAIDTWYPPATIQREDLALWGTRTLDIIDAEDPDGARRRLILYAKEKVA